MACDDMVKKLSESNEIKIKNVTVQAFGCQFMRINQVPSAAYALRVILHGTATTN